MRVKIRKVLDMNKPINIRTLQPVMKIYVGFMMKYRESDSYQRKLNRSLEAAAVARMQRDEKLKQLLLAQIYRELGSNFELGKQGKTCTNIIISVDAAYHKSLDRVLSHKDFLPYDIRRVPENSDLRKAFKNMPYLIEVSKKLVEGE